jgi:photosystem II stability/assembly factor-like uncharacterized protein
MQPFRLFAATGDAVARIDVRGDLGTSVELYLEGSGVQSVAADPHNPNRVYIGTHDEGVFRTLDGGASWQPAGETIPHKRTPSIAISSVHRENGNSVVYAGTEPSNLYRSEDDGETWREFSRLPELPSSSTWSFPPRPWTHHTRWITLHQHDPQLIFVGIELGGVMRSRDGGETWEDRKPGSQWDSHAIATHPLDASRVYEAAGGGVAASLNQGDTWFPVDDGMDRHYSWGLAVDPADPDLWYVSASYGARTAHRSNGDAQALLYRKRGDAPWLALNGTLPQPLPYMPYALLTLRERPGVLVVGMQHGEIMLSDDEGDSWTTLDIKLPGLLALSEASG